MRNEVGFYSFVPYPETSCSNGGYTCPTCGQFVLLGQSHVCPSYSYTCTPTTPCDNCKLWDKCKNYCSCFEPKESKKRIDCETCKRVYSLNKNTPPCEICKGE